MARKDNLAKALWRLTRFEHAILLGIASLAGIVIGSGSLPSGFYLLALVALVPMLNEAASFSLNDILDIESDRANGKSDRPLVSGAVPLPLAWGIAISGYAASIILASFINPVAFAIAVAFAALSVLYNYALKDFPLVGNAFIGLSMAIPFYFGAASAGVDPGLPVISVCLLAFVVGLGREIAKTIQDVEGDVKARGSRNIAVVLGARASAIASAVCYFLALPLSYLVYVYGIKPVPLSIFPVLASNALFFYLGFRIIASHGDAAFLKRARNISLLALALGLAGIVAGAI
ncbi:MAG: UbiA family prenyltransferase [Candidatus Micrarchaeia archaeon]